MINTPIINLDHCKIKLSTWLTNIEKTNEKINNLIYLLKKKDTDDNKIIEAFYFCDHLIETCVCPPKEILNHIKIHNISDLLTEYNATQYNYRILNNKWRMLLRNCVVHGHDFNKWHLKENF